MTYLESLLGPFVWIPPGASLMGESPGVRVTLAEGFWIGQHPVTNEVYGRFLAAAGHREPEYWHDPRFNKPDQPVVGVDFRDALAFCAWATKAAAFDDEREIRLPTEAQWEYVARAAGGDGQLREYPWGNEPPTPERAAFAGSELAPVGGRPAGTTRLGVHDLAGNVWEWCLDAYEPDLPGGPNPLVWEPPESAAPRAVRGGSWFSDGGSLRAAGRLGFDPGLRLDDLGFRVVCRGSRQHAGVPDGGTLPCSVSMTGKGVCSHGAACWDPHCRGRALRCVEPPVSPPSDMKAGLGKKPPVSDIPPAALTYMARGFQYGMAKYERGNYLRPAPEGMSDAERLLEYIAAIQRHASAWADSIIRHLGGGRNALASLQEACYAADGESKQPHAAHLGASFAMAVQQAVDAGLMPADAGTPWRE